ncbi:MAG TPA: aminotransferase class I/II-fold pyridoxal phosphate-dependent enzyme, partial [Solirubrobacterales bacterium]|nr:aminotransferase class I/II-fold pyridoxal phosphate-dependent enzyme [Solirubrobacterales bacterium]
MVSPAARLGKIPPYLFGEIARAKAKALAEGRDLIDLGIGDPDQPTPAPIIDALARAARDPATHRYDESDAGWPPFLASVARWYQRRFGVEIDPASEALLLIGSKEGLAHLAWAYVDAGDLSLVPDPAYTVYKMNTLLAGGSVHLMPLRAENGFLPVLEEVPEAIANHAKLLYLNYPNNPTGATATLEFFSHVVDYARRHNLIVCHDCAYSEVYFDGYRPPSFLQAPGAKEVGIEIHSVSKTFNMTGWRAGFAVGNREVLAALNKIKSNIDSKQFPAVDMAAAYALDTWTEDRETLRLYQRRRDILVAGLNRLGWNVQP